MRDNKDEFPLGTLISLYLISIMFFSLLSFNDKEFKKDMCEWKPTTRITYATSYLIRLFTVPTCWINKRLNFD